MYLEDAIKTRILQLMKQKNFESLWDLYKNSGISKSTINSLLAKSSTNSLPRLSTLLHICESLQITLKDFFNDDIFLDVVDPTEDK